MAFVGSTFVGARRLIAPEVVSQRRPRSRRARTVICAKKDRWFNVSAQQPIEAPAEFVYEEYANFEQMPQWTSWLESVTLEDKNEGISRWSIATQGVRFSWRAKNTEVMPGRKIAWESIDGLKNQGCAEFSPDSEKKTTMTVRLAFQLPRVISRLFASTYVKNFAEKKLASELQLLRTIVLAKYHQSLTGTQENKVAVPSTPADSELQEA
mmetsp:Transcript_10211/g.31195  ORF Transcript_10211/g.31195 Transcript_10211/m.31195 type:complete len:210 (+) Transcript_10211:219-848(+)|eukprot:CAMPEP_0198727334 /NCGR_PEP_ID=MMETSP1475-20131203/4099_1 /TAXON_ID= ORGANISM="Unidentified sp., Strain CCMP1999" /NCGR_SAMPLE_ID=MMETSP1475 /ASSEMBLY_ACC=CAM_ASM_001111 /LENGTH=209 /DNA_ID=CAMNT_0044489361 /DNA_START=115 /DNA_END=744 /DNA_ORIENTATION=+